ncbi:MAG TPA: glycosyltransferase family 2 protein [Vicinamibacterales bacterium]|nr:glycosyltransferase family 2 protein [Vicinamibacterales bacterium]
MTTSLVSAIVVNWNGGTILQDALASLFAQTYPALEVILVDNASTDASAEAAEARFGDKLVVIRNKKNEGFAGGNNIGFAAARGEWVFLLNPDAVCDPDTISELMRFVADKPETGQLACRIVQADQPNFFDSVGLLLYPDGVCRSRGWEEKDLGQYDRAEEVLAGHGCACAMRKAMLDHVGGFDEDFFCYLEDLDLGVRAQLAGWKCWYVPTARVRHRKSSSAGNYSVFKAYHVERNRLYCLWKWMPRFLVFVSPLFTLNRYAMQGYAVHTHQGLSSEFVKEYSLPRLFVLIIQAWVAATVRMPRMLSKRKQIRNMRKISVREWYDLISRFKLDAIELALKY